MYRLFVLCLAVMLILGWPSVGRNWYIEWKNIHIADIVEVIQNTFLRRCKSAKIDSNYEIMLYHWSHRR